jgi:hypothetical protein
LAIIHIMFAMKVVTLFGVCSSTTMGSVFSQSGFAEGAPWLRAPPYKHSPVWQIAAWLVQLGRKIASRVLSTLYPGTVVPKRFLLKPKAAGAFYRDDQTHWDDYRNYMMRMYRGSDPTYGPGNDQFEQEYERRWAEYNVTYRRYFRYFARHPEWKWLEEPFESAHQPFWNLPWPPTDYKDNYLALEFDTNPNDERFVDRPFYHLDLDRPPFCSWGREINSKWLKIWSAFQRNEIPSKRDPFWWGEWLDEHGNVAPDTVFGDTVHHPQAMEHRLPANDEPELGGAQYHDDPDNWDPWSDDSDDSSTHQDPAGIDNTNKVTTDEGTAVDGGAEVVEGASDSTVEFPVEDDSNRSHSHGINNGEGRGESRDYNGYDSGCAGGANSDDGRDGFDGSTIATDEPEEGLPEDDTGDMLGTGYDEHGRRFSWRLWLLRRLMYFMNENDEYLYA